MPQMGQAMIDVIIPTRGRGTLIDTTITSIRRSTCEIFNLYVIDQSDDDATERAVAPHAIADARVRYVHVSSRGISVARNYGVRISTAPYVLFTDDDCRVAPDWIGHMADELARDETWMVFGRILPGNGDQATGENGELEPQALQIALKNERQRAVYAGNRFNLGFGHGASMGLRRSIFERVGGFDELLGVGGRLHSWEDRDFGYRALRTGGRIVYTPKAVVYHRHWRGWQEVRDTYRSYAIGAGAASAKYIRCGDAAGWYMFGEWLLDQGVRQVVSGALKWHSWQKIQAGFLQLWFPWVGFVSGLRFPVDRERLLYRWPQVEASATATQKAK